MVKQKGITYSIMIRENYTRKTDGKSALYLRIIYHRKVKYYHTGFWVKPAHWNGKKVSTREKDHNSTNEALALLLSRVHDRITEAGAGLSVEDFDHLITGPQKNAKEKNDFFAFFRDFVGNHKSRLSPGTYQNYESEISKLKKFRDKLRYEDINRDFVNAYEEYMLSILHNKPNTVTKTFRKIIVVVKEAIKQGKIRKNPFEDYIMLKEPSNREYLSWDEVNKLEKLSTKHVKENMRTVLKAFLFACYTGLRYSDIRNLERENIRDNMIVIRMLKTGEAVSIPLTKKAAALINGHNGRLFRIYNNQKMNEYLKLAAIQTGIKKKVTFHVSRHTFATLSLNLGIPMEVVSKLLGHTDLKTTQIYAKLLDKTKVEMMKKWDEF